MTIRFDKFAAASKVQYDIDLSSPGGRYIIISHRNIFFPSRVTQGPKCPIGRTCILLCIAHSPK